jgi:hypothetical protein
MDAKVNSSDEIRNVTAKRIKAEEVTLPPDTIVTYFAFKDPGQLEEFAQEFKKPSSRHYGMVQRVGLDIQACGIYPFRMHTKNMTQIIGGIVDGHHENALLCILLKYRSVAREFMTMRFENGERKKYKQYFGYKKIRPADDSVEEAAKAYDDKMSQRKRINYAMVDHCLSLIHPVMYDILKFELPQQANLLTYVQMKEIEFVAHTIQKDVLAKTNLLFGLNTWKSVMNNTDDDYFDCNDPIKDLLYKCMTFDHDITVTVMLHFIKNHDIIFEFPNVMVVPLLVEDADDPLYQQMATDPCLIMKTFLKKARKCSAYKKIVYDYCFISK